MLNFNDASFSYRIASRDRKPPTIGNQDDRSCLKLLFASPGVVRDGCPGDLPCDVGTIKGLLWSRGQGNDKAESLLHEGTRGTRRTPDLEAAAQQESKADLNRWRMSGLWGRRYCAFVRQAAPRVTTTGRCVVHAPAEGSNVSTRRSLVLQSLFFSRQHELAPTPDLRRRRERPSLLFREGRTPPRHNDVLEPSVWS